MFKLRLKKKKKFSIIFLRSSSIYYPGKDHSDLFLRLTSCLVLLP